MRILAVIDKIFYCFNFRYGIGTDTTMWGSDVYTDSERFYKLRKRFSSTRRWLAFVVESMVWVFWKEDNIVRYDLIEALSF